MEKIYNTCKACGSFYSFSEDASADEMKFCPTCMDIKRCKIGGNEIEKPKKRKMSSIAQMNAAAKSMGMSYGQYMGWLHSGGFRD